MFLHVRQEFVNGHVNGHVINASRAFIALDPLIRLIGVLTGQDFVLERNAILHLILTGNRATHPGCVQTFQVLSPFSTAKFYVCFLRLSHGFYIQSR